jgi:hypothetical protein
MLMGATQNNELICKIIWKCLVIQKHMYQLNCAHAAHICPTTQRMARRSPVNDTYLRAAISANAPFADRLTELVVLLTKRHLSLLSAFSEPDLTHQCCAKYSILKILFSF